MKITIEFEDTKVKEFLYGLFGKKNVKESASQEKTPNILSNKNKYDIYIETRNVKLDECGLSVRTLNCLRANDIRTLAELLSCTENFVVRTRNFGKRSLDCLRQFLKSQGYDFGILPPIWVEGFKDDLAVKTDASTSSYIERSKFKTWEEFREFVKNENEKIYAQLKKDAQAQ